MKKLLDKVKLRIYETLQTGLKIIAALMAITFLIVIAYYTGAEHGRAENLRVKNKTINELELRINELELTKMHAISIAGDSLKILSKLNLKGKPYEYIHKERINPGENKYYYVLHEGLDGERLAIDMKIMKY